MLLKNKAMRQGTWSVAIAKPCQNPGRGAANRGRVPEKKGPNTPNEANSRFEINSLTQKTNPNEANKSFVFGVPP
jgi:hypothetical protein